MINLKSTVLALTSLLFSICLLYIMMPGVYAVDITCPDGTIVSYSDSNPNQTPCAGHESAATDSNSFTPTGKQLSTNKADKIYDRMTQFINFLSAIVGVVVVGSIIVGGIQYSTAGGDAQKVSAAKKRILNSIVAFFIFLFIYSFLQYIVPGGVFS